MLLLKEKEIPSMIYYRIPLHLQKVFRNFNYKVGDFPISENIANRILSLPMHPYLNNDDQNKIIKRLNLIFN